MSRVPSIGLICSMLLVTGCMGSPSAVPVTGTLTDASNHPLPDVLVQFHPTESTGQKIFGSSALTDKSGKFTLMCDSGEPGAVPGSHKVTLADNALVSEDEYDPKAPPKRAVNRIPSTYRSLTSTPLTITVEAGKSNYELKLGR